jgi:hypothetical protein
MADVKTTLNHSTRPKQARLTEVEPFAMPAKQWHQWYRGAKIHIVCTHQEEQASNQRTGNGTGSDRHSADADNSLQLHLLLRAHHPESSTTDGWVLLGAGNFHFTTTRSVFLQ